MLRTMNNVLVILNRFSVPQRSKERRIFVHGTVLEFAGQEAVYNARQVIETDQISFEF